MKNKASILLLILLIIFGCNQKQKKEAAKIPPPPYADNNSALSEKILHDYLKQQPEIIKNKNIVNPFNQLEYDKVIAYDYEGGKGENTVNIIDSSGNFASTITQQKALTAQQTNELTNFLCDNKTYGSGISMCFEPHLGIVFFNKEKPVAHVSICLECNYLRSSIEIPATSYKIIEISKDYKFPAEGFSKYGRQKINDLCQQLNFSHCSDTLNSMFDE